MIPWKFLVSKSTARHLRLNFLQVRTQFEKPHLPVCLPSTTLSRAMSSSPELQPQKRILAEESDNLLPSSSKKPRLVEESMSQPESNSAPPSFQAGPRADENNEIIKDLVPVAEMRMAVDGEEVLIQTGEVNRPSSSELRGNQSKGKKKRIRPPRAGRRSRNEEDEERGTLLSPTGEMGPKALRLPKRLCALLLGFCGSGYRGMQM